ncbi:putative armadillo-like helical protein [Helianthus annuus]|uniref:Armadillo-like helical protein n=1 Tax=Helianthus annuus TaxID=4232 RepID=A0A9K3IW86_HELAN|nr:putative armadillo-like helical protein [Helianthus annuus]KAJ0561778.1 putative armadillo-like helical protein [Helianthus annuus]KAJ0568543.1 putative armadillo-like helical protein [Helianthus annuus]KAJ0574842.1 putative armadillo-like helical protein [Helianthus annuus]KAJ0739172.1 putative armadillo-like helical protein [Helianthus annuus]
MRGNDNESVGAAADVVWDLSSYKHVLPVFHSFGVISLLVELLRSDDSNVKEKVCGAISQLSYDYAERVVIADLGGISVLISMLEDESKLKIMLLKRLFVYTRWCDRMSGALSHPVFLRVRGQMVQTRAAELRLAESVRQMTVDELTWNPALG